MTQENGEKLETSMITFSSKKARSVLVANSTNMTGVTIIFAAFINTKNLESFRAEFASNLKQKIEKLFARMKILLCTEYNISTE